MISATIQVKTSGHEEAARLPQLHRIRDSSQTGPVQYDGVIVSLAKLHVSLDSCQELKCRQWGGVGHFEFDMGSPFADRGRTISASERGSVACEPP